jgi:hypothetical protein
MGLLRRAGRTGGPTAAGCRAAAPEGGRAEATAASLVRSRARPGARCGPAVPSAACWRGCRPASATGWRAGEGCPTLHRRACARFEQPECQMAWRDRGFDRKNFRPVQVVPSESVALGKIQGSSPALKKCSRHPECRSSRCCWSSRNWEGMDALPCRVEESHLSGAGKIT